MTVVLEINQRIDGEGTDGGRVTVELDEILHVQLKARAQQERFSEAEAVVVAIRRFVADEWRPR